MKKTVVVFVLGMFVSGFCIGCGSGNKAPNGFPETVPFTITVTDGTNPMEGVNIQLIPQTKADWTAGGATDATGKLIPSTILFGHSQKGVPAGTYKVTLSKMEEAPSAKGMSMEEYRKKTKGFKAKQLCPTSVTEPKSTPIKADVVKDGELTIDTSKYK